MHLTRTSSPSLRTSVTRITSYNVCYTKLLRRIQPGTQGIVHPLTHSIDLGEILEIERQAVELDVRIDFGEPPAREGAAVQLADASYNFV